MSQPAKTPDPAQQRIQDLETALRTTVTRLLEFESSYYEEDDDGEMGGAAWALFHDIRRDLEFLLRPR